MLFSLSPLTIRKSYLPLSKVSPMTKVNQSSPRPEML